MARRYRKYNNSDDGLGIIILMFFSLIVSFVTKYWKIILITIGILVFLFVIIKYYKSIYYFLKSYKEKKIIDKLKKKSLLYSKIQELNSKYDLKDLEVFYDNYFVRFKSELSNCNIDDYLLMTINNKYNVLLEYKKKYDKTLKEYKKYLLEYSLLEKYIDIKEVENIRISSANYMKYQQKIYDSYKIQINCEFKVVIYINYRSKMGKVREHIYKNYNSGEFTSVLNEYFKIRDSKKIYEINSRVERAKMSESLRYDVLKRDNYRCCICGRSARDGAKLEVDHIIPVSKGGKTKIQNLQTLCSRCNIGKSNKI